MVNQKIFIFEFVSGGGYNKVDIPLSLFCEGYAMLRTTIEDKLSLSKEQSDVFLAVFIEVLLKHMQNRLITT